MSRHHGDTGKALSENTSLPRRREFRSQTRSFDEARIKIQYSKEKRRRMGPKGARPEGLGRQWPISLDILSGLSAPYNLSGRF